MEGAKERKANRNMIPFILVRLADIGTTLWAVSLGGTEMNPVNKYFLDMGIIRFIAIHIGLLLMIMGIYSIPQARLFRVAVNVLTWVNLLVVAVNIYVLIVIYTQGQII